MKNIRHSLIAIATAAAMLVSCIPTFAVAAPDPERDASADVSIIDVTVPVDFIFGGEAGLDIQDLGAVSASGTFTNRSNMPVRIKRVACDATDLNSYFEVGNANTATLSIADQQINWVPDKSEDAGIYDVSNNDQVVLFKTTDAEKDVTLSLNMTDMGLKDKVIEATKDPTALRDLMRISWTFEATNFSGDTNDNFYLKVKDDATHLDLRKYAGEVLSLADVQRVADDIATKGEDSSYYPMFNAMVTDVKFGTRGDDATVAAGQYECKVKWNDGEGGAPTSYDVRVIGINHDDLTTPTDGRTKAGLTFQFVNCLDTPYAMNASDTNSGGWANMELRTNLNTGTIWNAIPTAQQNAFKQVKKQYGPTYNSSSSAVSVSNDQVFIASLCELGGDQFTWDNEYGWGNSKHPWLKAEGYQYEYWAAKGATGQNVEHPVLVKGLQSDPGDAVVWWERSVNPNNSGSFLFIDSSGDPTYYHNPMLTHGVCPAFCL